jgi:hypothetical protein
MTAPTFNTVAPAGWTPSQTNSAGQTNYDDGTAPAGAVTTDPVGTQEQYGSGANTYRYTVGPNGTMLPTYASNGSGGLAAEATSTTGEVQDASGNWYNPNAASNVPGATSGQLDGQAIVNNILAQYGLQSLSAGAISAYVNSGDSADYLNYWITQTPQFNTAYPAYNQLAAKGQGITLAQYQSYNQSVAASAQAAGFPAGFITQDDITNFLMNNVSASEVSQRFSDASKVVTSLPTEDVNYLSTELGVSAGDLAAYFIDPTKSLPLIEQKVAAAQVGGAASRAGMNLDQGLASQLANLGVSSSSAQTGFGTISDQQQLYQPLPGQTGPAFDQAQQVGAAFGTDPNAAQQVRDVAAQRVGNFQQTGSFGSTSTGYKGLGTAVGS